MFNKYRGYLGRPRSKNYRGSNLNNFLINKKGKKIGKKRLRVNKSYNFEKKWKKTDGEGDLIDSYNIFSI